jgi:hypothetical protein
MPVPGTGGHGDLRSRGITDPIGQQELKVACRPSSGWAVASVSPDRIRAGPPGAPAWVAKIQRIKPQD